MAKITEREHIKYIRFDSDWYKNVEEKINYYLKENSKKFILENFASCIPLEKISVKFEEDEELFFIATISDKVSLEKQYTDGEREYVFEGIDIPGDVEKVLAHRVLMDMLGIKEGEKQMFIPASRAGLQMLYRHFFASYTKGNGGLSIPIYEFLKFLQTYTNKNIYSDDEIELIEFLENNLMGGKVEFRNNEFIFQEGESIIPLNYASSMIHELAIFTSMLKSNEDFKYIYYDEVENSVHPLVQGNVARAIIRLCNLGKKLIVSTHSDTMAGKINNLILLSRMRNVIEKNKKLEKIDLTMADMLGIEKNVRVYEFIKSKKGKVKVEELEFMAYPRIGYDFGRFNENIDQLYQESSFIME